MGGCGYWSGYFGRGRSDGREKRTSGDRGAEKGNLSIYINARHLYAYVEQGNEVGTAQTRRERAKEREGERAREGQKNLEIRNTHENGAPRVEISTARLVWQFDVWWKWAALI